MSLPGLLVLVLDRDGVLFRHVEPYIFSPRDLTILPGAQQAVRLAIELVVPVAVVTNQSPIGRGLTPWDFVRSVNARIHTWAPEGCGHRVRCYVCPHFPTTDLTAANHVPVCFCALRMTPMSISARRGWSVITTPIWPRRERLAAASRCT
ncbi:hypothetical protein ACFWDI_39415 [Streptomyces sp. NPDC060064]|uniref:hypothetical protein n=1 Tax=Streptomyces sp. NPDC060064 TaxID=3347049 RepID=UPI0036A3794B